MDISEQKQNLARFGEQVLAEPELHDRLRAAQNVMDFCELAVRLGAECGCLFTAPVVQAAVNEKRRAWLERWL